MSKVMSTEEIIQHWSNQRSFFKYRPFTDSHHFRALSHREVYFSSFEENRKDDPTEANNRFKIEKPSFGQIESFLRRKLGNELAHLKKEHRDKIIFDTIKSAPIFQNPKALEFFYNNEQEKQNNEFGIFCTSLNSASNYCWNKFASQSTGFVIGYDISFFVKPNISGQPMEYFDEPPHINWEIIAKISNRKDICFEYGNEIFTVKYCSKPSEFREEEEFRFLMSGVKSQSNRLAIVPSELIESIIIGTNMSLANEKKLREYAEMGNIDSSKIRRSGF